MATIRTTLARASSTVVLAVICIAVTASATLWWWLARPPAPALAVPDVIVLVTMDALRADHLGCYGYPRHTSPFIDRFLRTGVRFSKAFAPMATTAPSHASLFTSLYPLQHNVRKNGHVLDDSFLTMAESLRAIGYVTAAFVSTDKHFKAGNMQQGFDVFDEPPETVGKYRIGEHTVAQAIAWLSERPARGRFFLWVHLFDAHVPYNPAHRFPNASPEAGQRLLRFVIEQQHVDFGFFHRDGHKLLALMDAYDGEVAAVDRAVQRLFRHIETEFPTSKSFWIITSDHGEGLGNHRWLDHGKMIYNEQIRIPLMLHFPSGAFAGRVVDRVVENVDIFPTVAALTGESLDGQVPAIQGTSIVPLLLNSHDKLPPRYAFAQRRDFDKRPRRIIPERTVYESGKKYALQDGRYKYILRTAATDEFFHVEDDPYEVTNLIGSPSAGRDRLRNALLAKIDELKRGVTRTPKSVDARTKERLRALGYVE
ncbi:MAG: sulfatase [Candidatus Binatia bacterium]